MSSVGAGFGTARPKSRLHRIPKNPMDRCTIISIAPFEIKEFKHTLFPGTFVIPKASPDQFSMLVIEPSSWFKEQIDGPMLEIMCSSMQVAESIIKDYCNGLVKYTNGVSSPGLFYLLGEFNEVTAALHPEFKSKMATAREQQTNWFKELVKMADVDWSRTDGNPLSIANDSRIAAQLLGVDKNKSWMQDHVTYEKINCPACGHLVNPIFPVCPNCRNVINMAKAKELNLVFAKEN